MPKMESICIKVRTEKGWRWETVQGEKFGRFAIHPAVIEGITDSPLSTDPLGRMTLTHLPTGLKVVSGKRLTMVRLARLLSRQDGWDSSDVRKLTKTMAPQFRAAWDKVMHGKEKTA